MRLLIDDDTIAAHEAQAISWLDKEKYGIALVDGVRVRYTINADEAFINQKDLPLIKPTSDVQRAAIIKAQD